MRERVWRNGTILHGWQGRESVHPQWKTVRDFLKTKIELPYDTAIPLLGLYLENTKALIWKDACTPVFITALFTIRRTRKQPKCPLANKWTKQEQNIYIMEYFSTMKENEIIPFASSWTDTKIIIASEATQTKTNITWYHLYVEFLKKLYKWTYLQNRNRLTNLWLPKGR